MAEEVSLIFEAQTQDLVTADNRLNKLNKTGKQTAQVQKTVQNSVRRSNAALQNTAFQLQDIIVQLEGGVAPSRALGQQLPQLLGGFGAFGAVAGVVAGLAFALGGPLVNGLLGAKDSTKDLEAALEDLDEVIARTDEGTLQLTEEFKRLAQVGGVAFAAQLKEAINDSKDAIRAARDEAKSLAKSISPNELGGRFDKTKLRVELLKKEFIDGRIPLQEFAGELDKISLKSDALTGDFRELREGILDQASASKDAFERLEELRRVEGGSIQTVNEHQASIDRLIDNLRVQADASSDAANSTAFYRAKQLEASESELARIQSLQGVIDKQKELKAEEAQAAKEAAKAAAAAKALADKEAQQEKADARQLERLKTSLLSREDQVKASADREIQFLKEKGEKLGLLAEEQADLEARIGVKKQVELDKIAAQQKAAQTKERTEFVNSLTSQLGDLTSLLSSENKELFAIGKAASLANATIKGIESAIDAYAFGSKIGGPPVGAAFAAASAATTGALLAQISSAQPPARAIGGQVTEGQSYRVGEFGPETFVPSSSGRIIPNNQSAANDSRMVEVVNNIKVIGGDPNTKVTTQTTQQTDRKIIQDIIIDQMANQSSPARRALHSTSNVLPRGSR